MSDLRAERGRRVVPPLNAPRRRRGTDARRPTAVDVAPPARRSRRIGARQRLVAVVLDQASVVGFHAMTVSDLCELSGVSRRTFYNYFPDTAALFLAAYRDVDAELRQALWQASAASEESAETVLAALVDFACADPVRADAFFVQASAAGRSAVDLRRGTLGWCASLVAGAAVRPDGAPTPATLATEIACGGVWEVIRRRVADGDIAGLRRDAAALVTVGTACGAAGGPAAA